MSVVWFVVGAVVAAIGVGMVGYGIPISEFSFGNTLIVSGTIAIVGGLIVMAIGAAVAQLQRLTETLATRPPVRSSRPLEIFEPQTGAAAASGRFPFPPKTKSDPKSDPKSETGAGEPPLLMDAPMHAETAADEHASAAPMLRNPDLAEVAAEEYDVKEYEEVSLSPQQSSPAPRTADLSEPATPPVSASASPARPEPYDAPWRSVPPPPRPPQTSYFDTMWPAESRLARQPVSDEPKFKPKLEPKPDLPPPPSPEPTAAILKSGVVDGMGYTLYVDGSIEAELPNGILHFASINELREHLAKNS
jgi:hypothetical protein